MLKEQLRLVKAGKLEKHSWDNWRLIEIEEAIAQIEKGEDLYSDVDTPLCLKRGTTWREEYADAEEYFYDSGNNVELGAPDYFDPDRKLGWELNYQQPIVKENKTGRNDPCPCGSGKKYKKCCLDKDVRGNRN